MAITKLLLSISLWLFGVFWIEVIICKNLSPTTSFEFALGTEHVFCTNTSNQFFSIKLTEIYLKCDKQAHYYTVLHKIETAIEFQCERSCYNDSCAAYAYEFKKKIYFYPNIFNQSNSLPGLSNCTEIKAGLKKDVCGKSFKPCVYYRNYVEPLTVLPDVLSVFGCRKYMYKFSITLFTSDGRNETFDYETSDAKITMPNGLYIYIDTIDANYLTPDTSEQLFVVNEDKRFAIIDAKMRRQLVCATFADAKSLNMDKCSLNKSTCSCGYPDFTDHPIVCDCKQDPMTKLRFEEQLEFSNWFLRPIYLKDLDFYTIKLVPKVPSEILWKVEIGKI